MLPVKGNLGAKQLSADANALLSKHAKLLAADAKALLEDRNKRETTLGDPTLKSIDVVVAIRIGADTIILTEAYMARGFDPNEFVPLATRAVNIFRKLVGL